MSSRPAPLQPIRHPLITALPTAIDADRAYLHHHRSAKDSLGNSLTTGGDTVTLSTKPGTLGSVTDNRQHLSLP
jgi:hypothetical protein